MQESIIWEKEAPVLSNSIQEDLPQLFPEQIEDVLSIESRFEVGKGRMITNATGTGKTHTGLGVIKRFDLKGKSNIIIIVPTDDKAKDWIKTGNQFNLYITQLESVRDPGKGICVTTYANYYQNEAIPTREFDLIVYDESHYLLQNGAGKETSSYVQHKLMSSLPSKFENRGKYFEGEEPYISNGPTDLTNEQEREISLWRKRCYDKGLELYHKTKVLFFSATPFAYHKSIKYCDGLLWDIEEVINEAPNFPGYNEASGFDKFLCNNFGYHMKNGKLNKPDVEVNVSLLEREFFEKAKEDGLMSTRTLDLEFDYSRHFIKVDSDIGFKIDEFFEILWSINDKEMIKLRPIFRRHFNHLFMSKILESAKAEMYIERIKIHLMLGRKVIIFHGFNNINIEHPFYISNVSKLLVQDEKWRANSLQRILDNFYKAYPEYKDYDIKDLKSVPEIIKKAFGKKVAIYNGTIPKKRRRQNKEMFNDDNSGVDIFVGQSQASKEGIDLHDITGEMQRVSIDFSLPVRPPEAIQKEGRPYRRGSMSNAIYEYPTLQTNQERMAYAETVASRAKTVENLAMGNLARDLETAFKSGYENFEENVPSISQGRKGKSEDKKLISTISPYDRSLTYYYQRQKANKKKKKLYADFFATPEPLGYKMVSWANNKDSLKWLEPSAGDGSIARFFPKDHKATVLDIDVSLLSVCKLKVNATAHRMDFMEHKIINKYDRIIMNPPFGYGGKTAMEHLLKALIHISKDGWGKLYAIIPMGSSAEKHFDHMVNSENMKFFNYTGEILLPSCTFKKAGTSVMTRVVRFEGVNINPVFRSIDLTHIDKLNDFFEELRDLEF